MSHGFHVRRAFRSQVPERVSVAREIESLRAYRLARENAAASIPAEFIASLTRQIERVATEPLDQIAPLRNPRIE